MTHEPTEITMMLTPREARQILKIGRTTMYKLIRNHEIPVRKIGRKWRIPKAAFLKWIDCCEGMYLPRPCWEIKQCTVAERAACTIYQGNKELVD